MSEKPQTRDPVKTLLEYCKERPAKAAKVRSLVLENIGKSFMIGQSPFLLSLPEAWEFCNRYAAEVEPLLKKVNWSSLLPPPPSA